MTVDASRSCLGLGTCVGSPTRQIVVARVLLTAAAPPALPSSSASGGSLAPPCCDQLTAGGTCRAMAQTKPASSRAIAAVTTLAGLPCGRARDSGHWPKLCLPGDLTDRLGRTALSFDAQAPQGPCIAILHDRRADAVICANWDCDGAVPRFRCNGSATEKLLGTVPQRYRWFLVSAPPSVSKWANIESINGSAIAGRNPGSASNIADPRSSIV